LRFSLSLLLAAASYAAPLLTIDGVSIAGDPLIGADVLAIPSIAYVCCEDYVDSDYNDSCHGLTFSFADGRVRLDSVDRIGGMSVYEHHVNVLGRSWLIGDVVRVKSAVQQTGEQLYSGTDRAWVYQQARQVEPSPVPETPTWTLMLAALVALAWWRG
jgi:hypothetical protein